MDEYGNVVSPKRNKNRSMDGMSSSRSHSQSLRAHALLEAEALNQSVELAKTSARRKSSKRGSKQVKEQDQLVVPNQPTSSLPPARSGGGISTRSDGGVLSPKRTPKKRAKKM